MCDLTLNYTFQNRKYREIKIYKIYYAALIILYNH